MIEFFSHFAFAQMMLCALLLFPLRKKNQSILLFILLMFSGCGYLLTEMFFPLEQYSVLWWFELVGGNAIPGVFWLVSLSVFADHLSLKRWQYFVASLTLLIPLLSAIIQLTFQFDLTEHAKFYGFISYGALLLELVLISHALIISTQHWRDDLVQERRYIRGGVITVSALYIILVIVLEQLLKINWSGLSIISSFLLVFLMTGINFFLFQLKESSLFATVKINTKELNKTNPASKELKKIISAMVDDKIYQQEGITISSLASHLSIHEYKLRNLINGELNYRNFNDFLNYYRIDEVAKNLLEPNFSTTPVLTLALESGFRSLSSFNKAFKATHGITPTEYRKTKAS